MCLQLRPQRGGAFSRLSLSGLVHTAPPPQDTRLFFYLLALWQGAPLDVVLSADAPVFWVEAWTQALAGVREDHLRGVRFVLDGGGRDR
jgi:hypothetical protein